MRTKCRSIATFHRPIHSHWSLPLTGKLNKTYLFCRRFSSSLYKTIKVCQPDRYRYPREKEKENVLKDVLIKHLIKDVSKRYEHFVKNFVLNSVSNLVSLNPDKGFFGNPVTDPGLRWLKNPKIYSWKNLTNFNKKKPECNIYFYLWASSYRKSLPPPPPPPNHFKKWNNFFFFSLLRQIVVFPDPESDSKSNPDPKQWV